MQGATYSDQINIENEKRLRKLCRELPDFCREFFRELNRPPLPGPGLPTAMIFVSSFVFWKKNIRIWRTVP